MPLGKLLRVGLEYRITIMLYIGSSKGKSRQRSLVFCTRCGHKLRRKQFAPFLFFRICCTLNHEYGLPYRALQHPGVPDGQL